MHDRALDPFATTMLELLSDYCKACDAGDEDLVYDVQIAIRDFVDPFVRDAEEVNL